MRKLRLGGESYSAKVPQLFISHMRFPPTNLMTVTHRCPARMSRCQDGTGPHTTFGTFNPASLALCASTYTVPPFFTVSLFPNWKHNQGEHWIVEPDREFF